LAVNLLHRVTQHRSCGSRTQTKWPEDKLTAIGLDTSFWSTPDAARDRFVLVCGLIARERVSINKAVDDISPIEKEHMFTILDEKLDYLANLEEYVCKRQLRKLYQRLEP
jgi:hypothetical protein